MKKSRFTTDLEGQISRRQREIEVIRNASETQITKKKEEIAAIETVINLTGKSSYSDTMLAAPGMPKSSKKLSNRSLGQLRRHAKERGEKLDITQLDKKRKNAKPTITRDFRKKLKSPDWKIVIPAALKHSGTALNVRELVDRISPRAHKKTRKVLTLRCNSILSHLEKKGIVKAITKENGKRAFVL